MRWTKHAPTSEGYYWVRLQRRGHDVGPPHVVQVNAVGQYDNGDGMVPTRDLEGVWWTTSISPPPPAKPPRPARLRRKQL